MSPNFNLPPGCSAKDIEGAIRYSTTRKPRANPLSKTQARKLWKQYGKFFENERRQYKAYWASRKANET